MQAQTFRTAVDYVLVDVSVKHNGTPVTGLGPRDFVLVDAGVHQTIESVHAETLPIDVTLVIDGSGSVDGPVLAALTRGIDSVRRALGPDDRATVVTFNHAIREQGMVAANGVTPLVLPRPFGQTSLLDAATLALIRGPQPGRRQMAILFTDGIDTTSFTDATALLEVARRGDVAIFSVAVADRMTRSAVPPHAALLAELSTATGGAFTVMRTNEELSHLFVNAFQEFRRSYVLSYAYQGPAQSGWHPITVRLAKRGSFEVRARQGYFK
jgi:uncharacterized protein YegL